MMTTVGVADTARAAGVAMRFFRSHHWYKARQGGSVVNGRMPRK
jgi:hypothetical protein